jgi:ABC-type phosphate/phosphonate transport system ATPase subunit
MANGRIVFDGPPEELNASVVDQIYGRHVLENHPEVTDSEFDTPALVAVA